MCLLYRLIKVLCVKLEWGALQQLASQEKFHSSFFISLDRRSDAKINHRINISSNTTFARTLRKYSFDAKLCMRPRWSDVVKGGWLTGSRQLCVCVSVCVNTPLALPACLPDRLQPWGNYLDAHFNSSNSSPCCQRKQGVGLIPCNTFSPLRPNTASHFSLQHQNLRASYGIADRSLLLRRELAWRGVNEWEEGGREVEGGVAWFFL